MWSLKISIQNAKWAQYRVLGGGTCMVNSPWRDIKRKKARMFWNHILLHSKMTGSTNKGVTVIKSFPSYHSEPTGSALDAISSLCLQRLSLFCCSLTAPASLPSLCTLLGLWESPAGKAFDPAFTPPRSLPGPTPTDTLTLDLSSSPHPHPHPGAWRNSSSVSQASSHILEASVVLQAPRLFDEKLSLF